MRIVGKKLSREEREMRLRDARQWRIENKPYFDAIYGPETTRQNCPNCKGTGRIDA